MFGRSLGVMEDSAVPGDTASPIQLDYYRQKIVEFQNVLVQMDSAAEGAGDLIYIVDDVSLLEDLNGLLAEYDLKKGYFRTAAEALNLAISGVNLVGANFPAVKIPRGMNAIPLVAAAGIAAALAMAKIDGAVREADASPLGSIAQIVKWVAIAGLVYFGLQTFKSLKA